MPLYENVFIARQDVSSQQVETMTEEFTTLVTENGGTVAKTEYWGVRGLTYRIKKNRKGHYVLLNLDAPSDAVQELERQMRLHEDVIRYMSVRVEELEEGPSAMMQSRGGSRGGRGGRDGGRDRDDRPREDRPRADNDDKPAEKAEDKPVDKPADKPSETAGESKAAPETTASAED